MLVPGGRHGRTGPGFATPPKRPVLTLPVEGQPRRMIRQTSGGIVASPTPGGEEKTLIVALTVQGSGGSGRDRLVAGLAPGVHPNGAIRTQRWRTAVRSRVSTSFVQAGPRARGRAAGYGVSISPQRSRGHHENAPSSIERRKEAGKALRWSGRSQKTPGGVIQAFHFCGTICGTTFLSDCFCCIIGGEGGIRTPGTLLTYTHFPGVLLKPLGHLSRKHRG